VEADAGVMVLVVVPAEEALAEGAAILERAEAIRELRTVLERFELRFRVRVDASIDVKSDSVGGEVRTGAAAPLVKPTLRGILPHGSEAPWGPIPLRSGA
jgi:hypothetical protein